MSLKTRFSDHGTHIKISKDAADNVGPGHEDWPQQVDKGVKIMPRGAKSRFCMAGTYLQKSDVTEDITTSLTDWTAVNAGTPSGHHDRFSEHGTHFETGEGVDDVTTKMSEWSENSIKGGHIADKGAHGRFSDVHTHLQKGGGTKMREWSENNIKGGHIADKGAHGRFSDVCSTL